MFFIKGGLSYRKTDKLNLDLYVDADYAGLWTYEDDQDPICVKSRTGYVITLGGCPIHWVSKLQTEIALSTTEAEYIALAQGMREFIPIHRMYKDIMNNFSISCDPDSLIKCTIYEDNAGCISTCLAPKLSPCSKHIAVKYHFARQSFSKNFDTSNGTYVLEKIHSDFQRADILTKGLAQDKFEKLRFLLCGW